MLNTEQLKTTYNRLSNELKNVDVHKTSYYDLNALIKEANKFIGELCDIADTFSDNINGFNTRNINDVVASINNGQFQEIFNQCWEAFNVDLKNVN